MRASVTDDRAKVRNLRRDPRASLMVTSPDGWSYVVLEGEVTFSEVAAAPGDDAVEELVEVYRLIAGEHDDWDDYRRAMVQDRRLVLRLQVARAYGMPAPEAGGNAPPAPVCAAQPRRVLTSAREGFVAALPSGNTHRGHGLVAAVDAHDVVGARRVVLDVDLGVADALAVQRRTSGAGSSRTTSC